MLVIVQPDLGTASVLIAMMMGVLLIAGAKAKYILLITFLSAATVGAAVVSGVVNDYQIKRIGVFFDQDSNDIGARATGLPGRATRCEPSPPAASTARGGWKGRSPTPRTSRCNGPTSRSRRSASSSG